MICDTCIYRNRDEYHKPCIVYRDDCEFYEKERGDMTKEQENAINELQRMKMDKSHTGSEYNAIKTAIQAIKDLDKMNGIALDLASENDDLIEKMDSIRAEIARQERWLMDTGYNACSVDIAFDAIKSVLAESEDNE